MTNVMGRRTKQLLRNFVYSCSPISPGRRPPMKRRPLITLAAASAAMLGTSAFVALHADARHTDQQLVCLRAVPDAVRQQPARPGGGHERHRTEGVPAR